ncbi:non-ribosomal peptide synthetase [Streptomyces echinoruber]|uniref:Carrier domain-containing protein n=1 Tax=Streptomyces echinoruber TaxID=68898 RepID=A0A918V5J3_9ACTN|nr:non-ribosomal peptide synthetase [Streptomyces echinoruber]GGZ70941.1 hypothetical protein GCM10010389_05550 [Streptomyces echinoruber]
MDSTLYALFDRTLHEVPDAVAVHHPEAGVEVTYAQLGEHAERVAGRLLARGVTPGSFVAVCLPPGVARIAAFLGVWRVGAAYVSMEPTQPAMRHRFIAEDSRAVLVVTTPELASHFPGTPVLLLDDPADYDAPRAALPPLTTEPDDPAIVYYTSGTTGTPKGVVVAHASIAHFLSSIHELGLGPGDRTAQLNSPAFDAVTFEVWPTLTSGAALVVLPRELLTDGALLGEEVRNHGITVMLTATSAFHEIALQCPTALAPLRVLLVGGEAMDPRRARDVLASLSGRLWNAYGPTEATTFVIWHEITDVPEGTRTIPIGTPLPGVEARVLDADLRPVPDGRPGELFLGGPCLARGYLGRPELTEAAFVPDPARPGALLYRTGDIVRRGPDGALRYVGRTDHQVKIRGHRIELGEIEAQLLGRPEVASACVVVRGEGAARSLYGFVVPAADAPADLTARLREHLSRELPDWMVPRLTTLDRLPLTSIGKIDRAALSELVPAVPESAGPGADPDGLTPLERTLAGLWCELTGVDSVAPDDDFFAIGGHSLLVGRLNAKVRSLLGVQPPMRAYYTQSTLAAQARMLLANEPTPGHIDAALSALAEGARI